MKNPSSTMKEEISAAVEFLTWLVRKSTEVTTDQASLFQSSLDSILTEKFEGHWFPDQPCKGQAYRCIRVNSSVPCDASLEKAAKMSGVRYESLKLPLELTIWVDPQEVCCRFGENFGSFFTIASFKDKENLSNNIKFEDIPLTSVTAETPSDSSNKKTRRKPVDKPKKPASVKTAIPSFPARGYSPKVPFMNVKNFSSHPLSFVDWSPTIIPLSRVPHPQGYPDLQMLRRPRKVVRSGYLNDRYHWARK